jgi:hypothetical protein
VTETVSVSVLLMALTLALTLSIRVAGMTIALAIIVVWAVAVAWTLALAVGHTMGKSQAEMSFMTAAGIFFTLIVTIFVIFDWIVRSVAVHQYIGNDSHETGHAVIDRLARFDFDRLVRCFFGFLVIVSHSGCGKTDCEDGTN